MSKPAMSAVVAVPVGAVPPKPAPDDDDLALMRRLDELYTAHLFLGSRRMTAMPRAEGLRINRRHVQRLIRRMGIDAPGPKPRATKLAFGQKIYPHLLRDTTIDRPNQVWAADIPIGTSFPDLVAVIDRGQPSGVGAAFVQYHG